jgi:hypothetical protein
MDGRYVHHSWATPPDAFPINDMRIGNTLMNWEETIEQEFRLGGWWP